MSDLQIEKQLRETWKQDRKLCHIRGFVRSFIWLAMLIVLGLIIDYVFLYKTRMPAAISILLGLLGVATMAWVVWRDWISQLKDYNPKKIALDVEAENPELMSSLSSYTDFKEHEGSTASPELLEAMRAFAIQQSSKIKFSDVIDFSQLKKLFRYAAIVLLISGALSFQWSEHFKALFKRMAGIETTYPAQTKMTQISGDMLIPSGGVADIKISAEGVIPELAVLYMRPADESSDWQEMPMDKLENGFTFMRQIDAPDKEMTYYITMGDFRSEYYTISVVKAPRIVKTAVEITFPEYLDRSKDVSDQLNLEVPEGSVINWNLVSDKKISKLTVLSGDKSFDAKISADGKKISFSKTATKTFPYTFSWTEAGSGKSFSFEDVEYNVKVIKDALPRIAFVGRAPNGPATINKTVAFRWKAQDDNGLKTLHLVYNVTDPQTQAKVDSGKILISEHNGALTDSGFYQWELAKHIKDLKPGYQVGYNLELRDFKDDDPKHISMTPMQVIFISNKENYLSWFRKEMKVRNDLVKMTFVNERQASKDIELLLLKNEFKDDRNKIKELEIKQSSEAGKLGKVGGDLQWLYEELVSNKLLKEGGGKNLQTYYQVIEQISAEGLPIVTKYLRDARLEADQRKHHLKSAQEGVDNVVEALKKVLASSSTLLLEEALVTELKEMIKVQKDVRSKTAEWGKALLISPETAGANKGAITQRQNDMFKRFENFMTQLVQAKKDALDDEAKNRFEQVVFVLNPAPPASENKIVKGLLDPEPTTADFLKAAGKQIEIQDVLSAVGAQDRVVVLFQAALQILSANKFDMGEFIVGLERIIEKQRVLLSDVKKEQKLKEKNAFYEARQVEIQNEINDYSFDAPDLFVSKEGEFLLEPLLTEIADSIDTINEGDKEKNVVCQTKIIAMLESVYGAAKEEEEKNDSDRDVPYGASPVVPEELWKLPKNADTEEDDLAKADEDFPEIFEGITDVNLMIQSDSTAQGAQDDVSTAMAANRMLGLEEKEDSEPPKFVTDESPPAVGKDEHELKSSAGGKGDGNADKVEAERLARESMERRRQKEKIQEYVKKLPPEFRKQAADYYEIISK